MAATRGPVVVTDDGPVRIVTIDRPARRNAVDRVTADGLERAFRGFEADDTVAVAVLTGSGGAFCAGADLKAPAEGTASRFDPEVRRHSAPPGRSLRSVDAGAGVHRFTDRDR